MVLSSTEAKTITNAIPWVPYCTYTTNEPKTLFELFRPLHYDISLPQVASLDPSRALPAD